MLRHIKDRHDNVEGVRNQHDSHEGLKDPLKKDPRFKVRQVVVFDDQLDQLVAGNERQKHACYRNDD